MSDVRTVADTVDQIGDLEPGEIISARACC